MPIYLYWGEDDFTLQKAVADLRDRVLDPLWVSFNYNVFSPAQPDGVVQALNQAMTPPFGAGSRLVWLVDTNVCQQCSENLLLEVKRTLPVIPESCVLLLTCRSKPDGRLKSTQILKEYADIREFALIPPWEKEQLLQRVQQATKEVGVKLTRSCAEFLAESIGNDTRQLYNELEKLKIFALNTTKPLDVEAVRDLVRANTQSTFELAETILKGDTPRSLALVAELTNRNEPALKIVATLVRQFRTWLWVKLMVETGERDLKVIAQAAEVGNPNRVYILRQAVKSASVQELVLTLPLLLQLEVSLKQGAEENAALQTKVIQLCQIFK